jgi:hypothetical protein
LVCRERAARTVFMAFYIGFDGKTGVEADAGCAM